MPKKKGGKKKKGKKKKKMVGNETPEQVVRRLLKTYDRNCSTSNTLPCPGIRSRLKDAVENNELLTKFVLESVPVSTKDDPVVALEPMLMALRQERYTVIQNLHIWDMPLFHEDLASLAILLEKGAYPLRQLELMDCLVEPRPLGRLSLAFNPCETLSTIMLDYNEFGNEGCRALCEGLQGNTHLLSISMCYCDLGVESGTLLGQLVSTTAVRELFLDGNDLGCEGAVEIIKLAAYQAEAETYERLEEQRIIEQETQIATDQAKAERFIPCSSSNIANKASESEAEKSEEGKGITGKKKKKKKGKKKKTKEPPPPPPVGPWIHKLHLADNGIDSMGAGGGFVPLICMRLFRKLITHSTCLEELDLEDNLIGDLGGRELVEGLLDRKEAKLGGVKMRTTHRMSSDTFNTIIKLGVGLKKKKKKKGKKKKK